MSARASALAEVLWELKRSDKVATLTAVAHRAGFNAGPNCRTILNCLETVRRDWPHLHWWRAINDDGTVSHASEQSRLLQEWGVAVDSNVENGKVALLIDESKIMVWTDAEEAAPAKPAATAAE